MTRSTPLVGTLGEEDGRGEFLGTIRV